MKKFNTSERVTIGMDISDRSCHVVALYEEDGEIAWEGKLTTRGAALQKFFSQVGASRIALEAGPHSGWIWRLLSSLGHEVWVANARKLRLIYENKRKSDRVDAMYLARIARMDPLLLSPIEHRSEEAQADLGVLQARESLVRCRSRLISFCRSQVKTFGFRLPACSTASFHHKVQGELPWQCQSALDPIIDEIGNLTEKIRVYDRQVDRLCNEKYPQTARLRQIRGWGQSQHWPMFWSSMIRCALPAAGMWEPIWGCVRGNGRVEIGTSNCGSPRRGTGICVLCWCNALTTYWGTLGKTVIYDARVRR